MFTDLNDAYHSIRKKVSYKNLNRKNQQDLLNESYSDVRMCKYFSEVLPVQNDLEQEVLYRHFFPTSLRFVIKKIE